MPKLTKSIIALGLVVALSGCIAKADPIPVVFSRTADGTLVAQAPLCAGETVKWVTVGAKIGEEYRESGNAGGDVPNPSDATLTLDLSPEAIATGSLTDQWPMIAGPYLGLDDAVPDRLTFGMSTKRSRAIVSLIYVNPEPGKPVLVMGEVNATNRSTAITTIDPAAAAALLDTWCADQREKKS
jgi:hypothetical protein